MTIREEFERAFDKQEFERMSVTTMEVALWAANFMCEYIINNTNAGVDTERCCKRLKDGSHVSGCVGIVTDEIRELAKELEEKS